MHNLTVENYFTNLNRNLNLNIVTKIESGIFWTFYLCIDLSCKLYLCINDSLCFLPTTPWASSV